MVEYKGSHITTGDDTMEKVSIGQLWEARSKGRCALILATKKNREESLLGGCVVATECLGCPL